jgi:hypothetical protein
MDGQSLKEDIVNEKTICRVTKCGCPLRNVTFSIAVPEPQKKIRVNEKIIPRVTTAQMWAVRKFTDFLPSAIGGDFTDTILRGLYKLQQKSFSPPYFVVIECFNQNFQFSQKIRLNRPAATIFWLERSEKRNFVFSDLW